MSNYIMRASSMRVRTISVLFPVAPPENFMVSGVWWYSKYAS